MPRLLRSPLVLTAAVLIATLPLVGFVVLVSLVDGMLSPPRPTLELDRKGEPVLRGGKAPPVIGVVIDPSESRAADDEGADDAPGVRIAATFLPEASAAGLLEGDVIVSVGEQSVEDAAALRRIVREHAPGETVTLGVRRGSGGDEPVDLDVTLQPLPLTPENLGLPYDDVAFEGGGGLTARGWHVPVRGEARGTVVMMHGNASNRRSGLWLGRHLHDAGFALLLFDFTGRGDSDGEICTYGWRESDDARAAARLAADLLPGRPVVLYGRSLGAATALLAAADPRGAPVDAVVADSPYASLVEMIERSRADMGLPSWPFDRLFLSVVRRRGGFDPAGIEIARAAGVIRMPVLLLHGTEDSVVPPEHSERIARALAGPHRLERLDGLGHDGERPPEVVERIVSFLEERFGTTAEPRPVVTADAPGRDGAEDAGAAGVAAKP